MQQILKLIGWQGLVGIAVALVLGIMLLGAKSDARHWKKTAETCQRDFAQTVADYRAAAGIAIEKDKQNAERVKAEANAINERSQNDYETRLAAARASANKLRATAQSHSSSATKPAVSSVSPSTSKAVDATSEGGLSLADKLIATEQAIQLDELIKWVKAVGKINTNGADNGMVTSNSTGQ